MTKTMAHVEELRHVAAMDSCSWDYAQKLMRSSADEIERLDADAAGVQAELASVKLENERLQASERSAWNAAVIREEQIERLRVSLTMLVREAQNVADDHHRPRYFRLDQALESAGKTLEGAAVEPSEGLWPKSKAGEAPFCGCGSGDECRGQDEATNHGCICRIAWKEFERGQQSVKAFAGRSGIQGPGDEDQNSRPAPSTSVKSSEPRHERTCARYNGDIGFKNGVACTCGASAPPCRHGIPNNRYCGQCD